jgi:SAM-dependent methyltransferase
MAASLCRIAPLAASRSRLASTFAALEEDAWSNRAVTAAYEKGFASVTVGAIPALVRAVTPSDARRSAAPQALLDVACGLGKLVYAAAQGNHFDRIVGVDLSQAMIDRASSLAAAPVEFVRGDAERLPFESGSFDALTCAFGVLHMDKPKVFFAEAARVLRPGGRIAFSLWCPPPATEGYAIITEAMARHGAVRLPEGPPMFRYADAEAVAEDLAAAGFADAQSRACELVWRLESAAEFWTAIKDGTARTRAHINALTESDRRAMEATVMRECAARAQPDGILRLQMPAVVSSATRL